MADELIDARLFGDGALATSGVTVAPPLAYLAFKAAHLGFHAAMDTLRTPATPRHAFSSDAPAAWVRQWTAPTHTHAALLADVVPRWGAVDDSALACVEWAPPPPLPPPERAAGAAPPRASLPLALHARGVPSVVRALLDARVAAPNPLLDVALQHGVLTARVIASLAVDMTYCKPPRVMACSGATAAARRGVPLALHNGVPAAVWRLGGDTAADARVLQWGAALAPCDHGVVSSLALAVPVLTALGSATLLMTVLHCDAGTVLDGWANGAAPQRLADAARAATDVTHDFDAVVVPHVPSLRTRSHVPAVEGLVHAQWPTTDGSDMEAGACVIEAAIVHAQWHWRGAVDAHGAVPWQPRAVLAPLESVVAVHVLVVDGAAVAAALLPCHLAAQLADYANRAVGRAADELAVCVLPKDVVPWGKQ